MFQTANDRKYRGSRSEESLDWSEIVEGNVKTIVQADALIVEGFRFNYSQGHQAAFAFQQNKSVLNLYREDLSEYKEWPDKFFASGISRSLFTNKAYKDEEDPKEITAQF